MRLQSRHLGKISKRTMGQFSELDLPHPQCENPPSIVDNISSPSSNSSRLLLSILFSSSLKDYIEVVLLLLIDLLLSRSKSLIGLVERLSIVISSLLVDRIVLLIVLFSLSFFSTGISLSNVT